MKRTERVVSRDGTVIAYERAGQGPPVVLVVGALCSRTLGPGVTLSPALAGEFTVFTYDRRGRGESDEKKPYDVAREIDDLAALLGVAGGDAYIFGHSSGAVLALQAAARGLPIAKLALYEPPFIVDGGRPTTEKDWAQIDELMTAGRRADAVKVFLKSVQVPALVVAVMRWLPVWSQITAVAHTLPHDGTLVREFQRGEPLPRDACSGMRVPTLALYGGKSPRWMQDGTRALAAVLPCAESRVVEGQTHDVKAAALAPVLREFFTAPAH
ncbi:MAG TPA: alpha/beta hydrolase [Polyangiaceae bacterium]|jgi:pimeloyl-ACP methyl ester carboxylesterase|nr:alpha/beta hydrolase [Polyangiaceae bacterium]